MKTIHSVRAAIILIGILVSACAPTANSPTDVRGSESTGLAEVTSMGDQWTVKLDSPVLQDDSVTTQPIETPSAVDATEAATSAPEDLSTPQAAVLDDKGNEAFGTVDAIADTSITVGGQTYTFASGVEIKGDIVAGASVKLHFNVNADGTLSIREIEIADQTQIGDDNGADDGTGHDVNDDQGGNANDDGSNHDVNDDHGSDSNHDSNDDSSGGNNGSGG